MLERSTWPMTLVVALLVSWVEPAPCPAQSQPLPLPTLTQPSRSSSSTSTTPRVSLPPPRHFSESAGSAAPTSPASRTSGPTTHRVLLASGLTTTELSATQPGTIRGQETSEATSVLAPVQGELALRLKPAPLEMTDLRFPINLATALRLSDARPLIVAAAQASVWVAEAQLTRAKVLWVPMLAVGGDYIRHDGGGPDINKGIMTAPSVNFFYGGAGLDQYVAVTDAIFQPLVQRQILNAKQWDIQTAKNDALLMTATAYFNVHQYRGMYAGALYCVARGHDLVERIAHLSGELIPTVEVDRARNMVADLEQEAISARESCACTAPTSRRSCGSTPAQWSSRSSTITSSSP